MQRTYVAPAGDYAMQATSPSPLAVSTRDAAQMLGISTRTLWSLTAPRGPIPCVRVAGRVLYRPADLADYLDRLAAESQQKQEAGR